MSTQSVIFSWAASGFVRVVCCTHHPSVSTREAYVCTSCVGVNMEDAEQCGLGRVTGATPVCAFASLCVAAKRVNVDRACGSRRTGGRMAGRGSSGRVHVSSHHSVWTWRGCLLEGTAKCPQTGSHGGCIALTRSLGAGACSLSTCHWEKHQSPLEEAAPFRASGPLTRFSQAARDGTPYLTCGQTQCLRNKTNTCM